MSTMRTRIVLVLTVIGLVVAGASVATGAHRKPRPTQFKALASVAATGQALPADQATQVVVDAESFDPGNNFDPTTSSYTAPQDGIYQFDARAGVVQGTVPNRTYLALFVNDAEVARGIDTTEDGHFTGFPLSDLVSLTKGDVVTLRVYSEHAANIDTGNGSPYLTTLAGFRVK